MIVKRTLFILFWTAFTFLVLRDPAIPIEKEILRALLIAASIGFGLPLIRKLWDKPKLTS